MDTAKSGVSAHTTSALKEMSEHYSKLEELSGQLTTEDEINNFAKKNKNLTGADIKLLVEMTKDPTVRKRVIALSDPTAHSASLPAQMANTKNMLYDFFQNFSFQIENYPIVYYEKTPNEIFKDDYLKTKEGKQKRREFIDAIHLQHTDPVHIPLNTLKPNVEQEIRGYIGHLGYIPSLHLLQNKMPIIHNDLKEAVKKFHKGEIHSPQNLTKQKTRKTNRPTDQPLAVSDIPLYFVIYSPSVYHMSVIVLYGSRIYSFGFGYFGDTGDKKDEVQMSVLGRLTNQFHIQLGAIYTPDYLIDRNEPGYKYTIVDIGVFQPKHIENLESILAEFVPGADVSIKHEEFSQIENDVGFVFKPTRLNLTMDKENGKYHSLCNVNTKNMNCTNFIEKIFGTDRISCSADTNLLVLPNLCQRKPTPLTIEETKDVFDMYKNNQYDDMIAYLGVSRPKKRKTRRGQSLTGSGQSRTGSGQSRTGSKTRKIQRRK